jgi:hypothetical protein
MDNTQAQPKGAKSLPWMPDTKKTGMNTDGTTNVATTTALRTSRPEVPAAGLLCAEVWMRGNYRSGWFCGTLSVESVGSRVT